MDKRNVGYNSDLWLTRNWAQLNVDRFNRCITTKWPNLHQRILLAIKCNWSIIPVFLFYHVGSHSNFESLTEYILFPLIGRIKGFFWLIVKPDKKQSWILRIPASDHVWFVWCGFNIDSTLSELKEISWHITLRSDYLWNGRSLDDPTGHVTLSSLRLTFCLFGA